MKHLTLYILCLVATVLLPACAGSKRVTKTTTESTVQKEEVDELERLKRQMEMENLQAELELNRMKHEAAKERLKSQLDAEEQMKKGNKAILMFCIDEAMDKPGEYMAGYGVSSNQLDEKDALISANEVALADIASRFLGVIKNGVEAYNKETNTVQRNKSKESQLEGLAAAYGTKAINKYANRVCHKFVTEKEGTYGCYTAVHVPVKEVVDEIADALETEKVDVDKELFRRRMNAELNAEQTKKAEEQRRQQDEYDKLLNTKE